MAPRTKIKWNRAAFEQIRRSPGVEARLRKEVDRVLDKVGRDDYEGGVEPGKSRSRGYVVTKTADAIRKESEGHTLGGALADGGGE